MANLIGILFDSSKKSHWAVAVLFLLLGATTAHTYASVTETKTELKSKADNETIRQMLEQNERLLTIQQQQMDLSRSELRMLELRLSETHLKNSLEIGELRLEQRSLSDNTARTHEELLKMLAELKSAVNELNQKVAQGN